MEKVRDSKFSEPVTNVNVALTSGKQGLGRNQLHIHQRIGLIFLVMLYIPYMLVLASSYNVFYLSLSRIAWQHHGFFFLLAYVGLTIPFLIYQIQLIIRNKFVRSNLFRLLASIGVILLLCGSFIPFRKTDYALTLNLHRFCGTAGAILLISLITYLFIKVDIRRKEHFIKGLVVTILYVILLMLTGIFYLEIGMNAVFEIGFTFTFLVVFQFINSEWLRNLKK